MFASAKEMSRTLRKVAIFFETETYRLATFQICNTLIVDLHPDRPATASASVSIVRCSVAAIGVSILQFILENLGPGWTFTIFGALGAATAPMLWVEWDKGKRWRTERLEKKTTVQHEKS